MNTKINGTEVGILDSKNETVNIANDVVEEFLQEFVGKRRSKKLAETIIMELHSLEESNAEEVWNRIGLLLEKQGLEDEEVQEFRAFIQEHSKQEVDGIEIPEGFHYVTGSNQEGVVIEDQKGNQFTTFKEIDFWVSRYEISAPGMSIAGKNAWTNINFPDARYVAKSFAKNADLINERRWDSLMQAISSRIGRELVYEDSTSIGAYNTCREIKTGSNPSYMVCNIDCLAGSHFCWIVRKENCEAIGGSTCLNKSFNYPMSTRFDRNPFRILDYISFRIVLGK